MVQQRAKRVRNPGRTEPAKQRLDAAAAAVLAQTLGSSAEPPIELDASCVELLGAQALQVLLAARHPARPARPFSIVDPSDAFVRDAALLGFGHDLVPLTTAAR